MIGEIYKIFDTQSFESGFSKREFVVKDNSSPEYPQYFRMEFIKDKTTLLDNFKTGDNVEIEYNLRGNLYNHPEKGEMFFTTIQAWKIKKIEGSQQQVSSGGDSMPWD